MAGIDWEAAAKAAMSEVATDLRNEESNAKRIACDIGEKIGKDRNADVETLRRELQQSQAKAAGITKAQEVMRDYFIRNKPATPQAQ